MKKAGKIILILVIVLLIGGIICGGYFLYKNNLKKNSAEVLIDENLSINYLNGRKFEFNDKEKEINFSVINDKKNNKTNNEINNKKITVKEFSDNDVVASNGLKLGMFGEDVIKIIKDGPSDHKTINEDATGDIVNQSKYDNLGLELEYRSEDGEGTLSSITWTKNSIKTARGITIGSTESEVLSAYTKDSILAIDNEQSDGTKIVTIGFKGDDPVYNVNNKSKIFITISSGKVTKIVISYGHLN